MLDSLKQYDNVWLQPRTKRNTWAKELKSLGIKDLNKEKAEVLLFVGCTYGLCEGAERHGRQYRQNPQETKVDFGTLGDKELCCGSPPKRPASLPNSNGWQRPI